MGKIQDAAARLYVPLDEYVVKEGKCMQVVKSVTDNGRYVKDGYGHVLVRDRTVSMEEILDKYPEVMV